MRRHDNDARKRAARALAGAVLALWVLGLNGCVADEDGPVDRPDASADASVDPVVGQDARADSEEMESDEAGGDGAEPEDADGEAPPASLGAPCQSHAECDDGNPCNGQERCEPSADAQDSYCRAGFACTDDHPCTPTGCDCAIPSKDDDGVPALECAAPDDDPRTFDCDDTRTDVNPAAEEVCDADDLDEDCDPKTYGFRDQDGDGEVDHLCKNRDPSTGAVEHGPDCNDLNDLINTSADDICDGIDNNCDGKYDEDADGVEYGRRVRCYRDRDHDLYGDAHAFVLACFPPVGYVDNHDDPDDEDANVHPGAPEICDGKDNDNQNGVDEEDPHLVRYIEFRDTTVRCVEGDPPHLAITECPADTLWCPGRYQCLSDTPWCAAKIERGCDVDATRLTSCRACDTHCRFACGQDGCDEIQKVAVGGDFACALTDEGRVACWGRASRGVLGSEDSRSSSIPQFVPLLENVTDLAVGFSHACAVVGPQRQLQCWGNNATGQLGSGTAPTGAGAFSASPTDTTGVESSLLTGVVHVALADDVNRTDRGHSCAVLDSGELVCWGEQLNGRVANGRTDSGVAPPEIARRRIIRADNSVTFREIDNAESVALGSQHGCVLTDEETVECWGDNSLGQLGDGTSDTESGASRPVPGLENVSALAAGAYHTCALTAGKVLCWGDDSLLQLGRPASNEHGIPAIVEGLPDARAITAGLASTCAITDSDEIWCWGSNEHGERGDSEQEASYQPTRIPLEGVAEASAGGHVVCAATEGRAAFCWGDNQYGQLGKGQAARPPQPQPSAISSERETKL